MTASHRISLFPVVAQQCVPVVSSLLHAILRTNLHKADLWRSVWYVPLSSSLKAIFSRLFLPLSLVCIALACIPRRGGGRGSGIDGEAYLHAKDHARGGEAEAPPPQPLQGPPGGSRLLRSRAPHLF